MPEAKGTDKPTATGTLPAAPGQSWIDGIVVAIAPGFAEVHTTHGDLLCTYRGRLRRTAASARQRAPTSRALAGKRGSPARASRAAGSAAAGTATNEAVRFAAGDRVRVTPLGGATGVIEELYPRRTTLLRAAAGDAVGGHVMLANLDHAVLVFAVSEPAPHFGMLDRYLALCAHAVVDVTICLNKVDLGVPSNVEEAARMYMGLGYRVLFTSALTGAHLTELRDLLRERVTLLTGPSGVGKSSLVNALLPQASQRISAVSTATGKGRHTTTGSRLLPLPGGGWLADSAGIRELTLWNVPATELPRCFVELRPMADACGYDDCEHGPEDEACALRQALASGKITTARFASFERLLREARAEADVRT